MLFRQSKNIPLLRSNPIMFALPSLLAPYCFLFLCIHPSPFRTRQSNAQLSATIPDILQLHSLGHCTVAVFYPCYRKKFVCIDKILVGCSLATQCLYLGPPWSSSNMVPSLLWMLDKPRQPLQKKQLWGVLHGQLFYLYRVGYSWGFLIWRLLNLINIVILTAEKIKKVNTPKSRP